MITPSEIQAAEFSKSVRGYNPEEVDTLLDNITVAMEQLMSENERLLKQIDEQQERISQYKQQEGAMLNTLEAAKSLMNDISASAEKRAEILIRNAELDADLKLRQAREAVERLQDEERRLTQRVGSLRTRMKSILESELERVDGMSEDIIGNTGADFISDKDLDSTSESFLSKFGSSFGDSKASEEIKAQDDKVADLTRTITNYRGKV